MTPDQAKVAAEMFATLWQDEFPATCQVLAAVKDESRDSVNDVVEFYKKNFPDSGRRCRTSTARVRTPTDSGACR
jgi:hypothetical protein